MDVSQYLDIFIDETNEHLQDLSDCIMAIEQEPDNMDTVNEIFRAAHSLKGMAGTMGFKRMQRLTHDMENVFQEVRSGNMTVTSSLVDVLFQCLDALDAYLENVKSTSNEGTNDNEAIINQLNVILNEETAGGGAGGEASGPAEEESKEEASVTADSGSDAGKYTNKCSLSDLDQKSTEALREAAEKASHVYGVTVYISEECLLKAARAFLVFKAVEELGTIAVYRPSSHDIEDERFEFDFSFYMASNAPLDKVIAAAKTVTEIVEVVGVELDMGGSAASQPESEETAVEEAKTKEHTTAATPAPVSAPQPAPAKKPAQADKKQPAGKQVGNRTVRVDIEKLDALMNQVSELIIAKNSMVSISATEGGSMQSQSFHEQIEYLERITTTLHESVMKVRMVPIESVVNKFPRMIRDLSKKLDKKMELHMSGEDTELDRTVVDQIGDPLQHLLRNSADHGLESAEVRRKLGKPETGAIYLNAFQEGNNVIIEVSDDGSGINTDKVMEKAIERGIITLEQGEAMSQKEIIDMLFMPSFSMAKEITDISGRGVGLDVVKSNIEALGGDVEVKSVLGEGSKFTVRLPLTLAIIQALMVEIGEEKYAIPLGSIQTIESISEEEIKYVQADEVIHIRGSVIPLVRLEQILDIPPREETKRNLTVVIIKKGEKFAGLVVDSLVGQQEIVIKSLGMYIDSSKLISGATILGDGEVALILDVNTLL